MSRNKIWVIDDDRAMRWVLEKTFKEEGFDVTNFEEAQTALERLHHDAPDVILTDIRMPGIDGLTFLSKVKNSHPDLPVIIMTAHSDLESAVSSYQTGAFEYLPKPFDIPTYFCKRKPRQVFPNGHGRTTFDERSSRTCS
ncbi:response regulator [Klebsiella pneumoniae]